MLVLVSAGLLGYCMFGRCLIVAVHQKTKEDMSREPELWGDTDPQLKSYLERG